MPRSVVRPNQSNKHMAVLLTIRAMGMVEIIPTKTNKIPAAALQYLAGYFSLPFTAKPRIDDLISALNIPTQFIRNIRIIEQYHEGKDVPAKYSYEDALAGYRAWIEQVREGVRDDVTDGAEYQSEEGAGDPGEGVVRQSDEYTDQLSSWVAAEVLNDGTTTEDSPIPAPDGVSPESWEYAKRFVQALRSEGAFDEGAFEEAEEGDTEEGIAWYESEEEE